MKTILVLCIACTALWSLSTLVCSSDPADGSLVVVSDPTDVKEEVAGTGVQSDSSLPHKEFKPSDEWKVVEEGMAIPPGLHVRIDMQTGKKEARLMEEQVGVQTLSEKRANKLNEVQGILRNSSWNETGVVDYADVINGMKKESLASHAATMMTLLERAIHEDTPMDARQDALDDLEQLSHDIQYAQDFSNAGGYDIILALLPTFSDDMTSPFALILGAAAQNNDEVITRLLETDAMQILLAKISTCESVKAKKHLLFAVSSCLQHSDVAAAEFKRNDGLEYLSSVLAQPDLPTFAPLKAKVLTIGLDLLISEGQDDDYRDRALFLKGLASRVASSSLLEAMVANQWCEHNGHVILTSDTNTMLEISLEFAVVTNSKCSMVYGQSNMQDRFAQLDQLWQANGEYESYLKGLVKLVH